MREILRRASRRTLSVSVLLLLWSLGSFLLLPGLAFLALLDLVAPMRPWARVRAVLSIQWILTCEVLGVLVSLLVWLAFLVHRKGQRFLRHNTAVQRVWTDSLFAGCRWIYSMSVEAEGLESVGRGPLLFFVRHASLVDTVLTAALLANPHRLRLRYVLKDELLFDPCIDIVGNRLPNAFVSRGEDSERDIAKVRELAKGLADDEGVLIYPEGTRFSPKKLEKVKARLLADPRFGERVQRFVGLLPPRPGGALALLTAAPDVDLVLLAHSGLEGAATLRDFWRGELVGTRLRISARRIRASEIPVEARQELGWLLDRWLEMDHWLSQTGSRVGQAREHDPQP